MRVLAGDIGGTNARLALYDVAGARCAPEVMQTYPSREYDSLEEIVRRFIDAHRIATSRACFGVPGPVKGGRAQTTNLPWVVEAAKLSADTGLKRVDILNDLEAQAYGIATLDPEDLVELNPGDPSAVGNRALIAAGTGLGQAGLYWDGEEHRPFACEGGHTTFAPRGDLQLALSDHLADRYGHVSWERVVSGPGLVNIYGFLVEFRGAETPGWLAEQLVGDDPAAAISKAALEGRSEICREALDLFVELYGAEAGNLALKIMATGGLYLGGGIAPEIVEPLREGRFLTAFSAKGRMRPLLEAMPVRLILNEQTALLGAARYAALFGSG